VFAAVAASGAVIGGGHAFDRFSLVPVVMHLDRTKRVASAIGQLPMPRRRLASLRPNS
jgi:hypothetical protein